MRIAIDALNLRADARGLGRLVRGAIAALAHRDTVTLLVRARDRASTQTAFPLVQVDVIERARDRDAFDVVWFPWNGIRFFTAAPSVVTIADDFAFRFPARGIVARSREQRPIRRAIADATRLSTISQWSQRELAERFARPRDAFSLIALAPDRAFTAVAPSVAATAFVADPTLAAIARPFVLVVANSEPRKGLAVFLEAFAALPARERVALVVAGAPSARDRAQLAALDAHVLTPTDDTLRTLYRRALCVAVPSLAEGFGLVVVEAQACGAAIIASNATAVPEAAGDAALLVAPGAVGAWTEALAALIATRAQRVDLQRRSLRRWARSDRNVTAPALRELFARAIHDRR